MTTFLLVAVAFGLGYLLGRRNQPVTEEQVVGLVEDPEATVRLVMTDIMSDAMRAEQEIKRLANPGTPITEPFRGTARVRPPNREWPQ